MEPIPNVKQAAKHLLEVCENQEIRSYVSALVPLRPLKYALERLELSLKKEPEEKEDA